MASYPEMVSVVNHWELWEIPVLFWQEMGIGMGKKFWSHPAPS